MLPALKLLVLRLLPVLRLLLVLLLRLLLLTLLLMRMWMWILMLMLMLMQGQVQGQVLLLYTSPWSQVPRFLPYCMVELLVLFCLLLLVEMHQQLTWTRLKICGHQNHRHGVIGQFLQHHQFRQRHHHHHQYHYLRHHHHHQCFP
jgi:hypothetical protein